MSFESPGVVTPLTVPVRIGAPVAQGQPPNTVNQLIIGPPPRARWRVRCVRSLYTCDATAGDRTLVAAINSQSQAGDVWSAAAGTVAQAGDLIEISGAGQGNAGQVDAGPGNNGEGILRIVNIAWPDVWLTPDLSLRLWVFTGYGAGDTFSAAFAYVEQIQ